MGHAFDRHGNVLGEAYGETKREVFDKLMSEFKDAHEIRIRDMAPAEGAPGSPSVEMPRYHSHKVVHALKIRDVSDPTAPGNESDGSRLLHFEEPGYGAMRVGREYVRKHAPQAGGYYVVYDDGYTSWSPAKAFEDGYMRVRWVIQR